ncbi:hypothetical protein QVD17_19138 [Tagetes erecta]|uniref:Uncharacterized protein n=1 Tax=Tagetes erecta TaxID=13708 RepID=A0AAD8NX06_TARER|nr:hypothetical protein QVD17_19138 [Tagetes erecta]
MIHNVAICLMQGFQDCVPKSGEFEYDKHQRLLNNVNRIHKFTREIVDDVAGVALVTYCMKPWSCGKLKFR